MLTSGPRGGGRARSGAAAGLLAAVGLAVGCSAGVDGRPRPAPSASAAGTAGPSAPASKRELAARIDERLADIKEVPPERTAEHHALASACLDIGRLDGAVTADVAGRLGLPDAVVADLRAAAGECGTAPAVAAERLRRVVGALRAG